MKKKEFKKTFLKPGFFFLILILGLPLAANVVAAPGSSSITDTPNPPIKNTAQNAPADSVVGLTQTPNQSNGIFSDPGCDICGTGEQSIADNFVLGDSMTVNQIILWGGYHPNNTPLAEDDFTVIIHEDNAGLPGTIVYNNTGIAPTERADTGVDLFGVDEYRFTLDLPSPATLPAGTYWIEIFNDTSSMTDDFFWETGTLDAINGIAGSSFAFETPGVSWSTDSTQDLAFQLLYVPAETTPVPSMGEWGMIILTILIAGFSFWMMRQKKAEI